MKFLLLLTTLFVFATLVQSDLVEKCRLQNFNLGDREEKIATHFEDLIKSGDEIDFECLDFLMARGFYKTAVDVYEQYFILNSIDITEQIKQMLSLDPSLQNNRDLQYIFKHALSQSYKIQTVQPVINWAQSRNHTLINIKFSHRVDAPACLNTKIEDIQVKDNKVYIRAFGIVSHIPIKYEATINLFKPIQASLSTHKYEAMGTMFFNLTKLEENNLWIRLTIEDIKTPIWWDLRDNLKQDMDDFIQLLEEHAEVKEKNSDKKYRKKQKQREKEKERQEKLDKIEKQRQWDFERNQCSVVTQRCENGWYQRQ